MQSRPLRLTFLAILAVVFFHASGAQTASSGGLAGVVTDQSGAVLPNAEIEMKDNSKGTLQSAKSDENGVYRFFFLAPGRYTLTVMHDRFREEMRTVSILLGPPGTLNMSLKLARRTRKSR